MVELLETYEMAKNITHRLLALFAGSWLLASCAGGYSPPPPEMKIPPLWAGEAELDPPRREIEYHTGLKRGGDLLVKTRDMKFREGRIVDEIKYKNANGKDVIIPANTPVYAKQLSVSITYTTNALSRTVNLNEVTNPIEWCYSTEQENFCIFFERDSQARYVKLNLVPFVNSPRRNGSAIIGMDEGRVAPLPNIIEGDEDFGGAVFEFEKIVDINDEGFSIISTLKDGLLKEIETGRTRYIWRGYSKLAVNPWIFEAVKNAEGKIDSVEATIETPLRSNYHGGVIHRSN